VYGVNTDTFVPLHFNVGPIRAKPKVREILAVAEGLGPFEHPQKIIPGEVAVNIFVEGDLQPRHKPTWLSNDVTESVKKT